METLPLWTPIVFFAIAVIYSSVGLGGGSSYLAVLALLGLPHVVIPQVALICNLVVAAGGAWHFGRGGHFARGRFLPFMVLSIPMAYLGGRIPVSRTLFVILLGAALLAAGVRMLLPVTVGASGKAVRRLSGARSWCVGLPVGAGLGFLSGLVGIGGGIFLAPVLLLTAWADAKQAAAASALFIVLNSAAGLIGQFSKGFFVDTRMLPLAVAVLLGGQLGARIGAFHLPVLGVRRLLATLIVVVALRLLWSVT